MQCPRCHAPITTAPDPGGYMLCPGCGAKLLSRPVKPKAPEGAPPAGTSSADPDDHPPGQTLPSSAIAAKKPRRPGQDTTPSAGRNPSRSPAPVLERPPVPEAAPFDEILAEIRALRSIQDEILQLLRSGWDAPVFEDRPVTSSFQGFRQEAPAPAIRSRRRKTVLLIDDDPESRQATVAALEQAEVPVRAVGDGTGGIEAIAQEKPDVIVLELALGGDIAGKDIINTIKATMEWVDIPIVLYTRASVESQKEARAIHGADEVVLKQSGPQALVTRVISVFRSR